MMRFWIAISLFALSISVSAQSRLLHIGILASDDAKVEQTLWTPLIEKLEAQLPGTRVTLRVYSFEALEAAIQRREVDVIMTEGTHYLALSSRIGLEAPVASIVRYIEGKPVPGLAGTVLVRSDSPIQDIEDFNSRKIPLQRQQGTVVAVAEIHSLAGFQAQAFETIRDKILGSNLGFSTRVTGLPHANAVRELLAGNADAAFVPAGTLEAMLASGSVLEGQLRVVNPIRVPGYPYLVSTPLYPDYAVVLMPQIEIDQARVLAGSLLKIDAISSRFLFVLPQNYSQVVSLATALRLPPYGTIPAVTLGEILRDHQIILVLMLGGALLILALTMFLSWYVLRLRRVQTIVNTTSENLDIERSRLTTLLNTIPDMVWMKDLDGVIRYCNQSFADMFNTSVNQLLGKTDFDLVDSDAAQEFRRNDRRALESGRVTTVEETLMMQEPAIHRLFRSSKAPVRNSSGEIIGILGVAHDITSLREIQIQLRERIKEQKCLHEVFMLTEHAGMDHAEMLQKVVEAIPPGWFYPEVTAAQITLDGRTYATSNFRQDERLALLRTELVAGGEVRGYIDVVYLEDRPVLDEGPFLKEERTLLDAIAMRVMNVMERKRIEGQAHERELIYSAIVSQANEGIALVDSKSLAFKEFNDSACKMLGYEREEFSQQDLSDLEPQHDRRQLKPKGFDLVTMYEQIESGSSAYDTTLACKGGEVLPVYLSVRQIELQGTTYLSLIWKSIRQRIQAEEVLQESERRFRVLFEEVRIPFTLLENGVFVDANKSVLDLLGLEHPSELLGKRPEQLSPEYQPDGTPSDIGARDKIALAMKHGSVTFEWTHLKKDGTPLLVEIILTRVYLRGREYFHVAWIDITQRREDEVQLKKLSLAVEQSPASIVITDLDARIEYVNKAFERYSGYSFAEAQGKNPRILNSGRTPTEIFRQMWDNLMRGEAWQGEIINRHRNGTEFIEWAYISPIRNAEGAITHYIGINQDVTAQRNIEKKLREREAQYHSAIETTTEGFWAVNSSGYVIEVNDAYCKRSGYTREEIVGEPIAKFDIDDDADKVRQRISQITRDGHATFETRHRARDGSIWPVEIVVSFDKNNDGIIFCFLRDVTEEKRARKEIEQYRDHLEELVRQRTAELEVARNQAESANRSKSTFLANMSHEIRTPMNAILGFTYLLQQDLQAPAQRDKLEKIISSAKHLLGLINDILDLSKIEADRLVLDETDFNIAATADRACSMISERVAQNRNQLHEEIDPRLANMIVKGDPLRFNQILINYLGNAAKFTEKGTITLRLHVIEQTPDSVLIRGEVQDTGIGISEEHQRRLFQPFEQGEQDTTRKYGGTGLGLVISRRLARMMGGDTGVVSAPGAGSTFWFTARFKLSLQGDQVVIVKPQRAATMSMPRKGAHVLLVEDNQINQDVSRELLEKVGLQVDIANHGGEALERVRQQTYDAILMDMRMPVMDGVEATRAIRKSGVTIPVIAMTANAFSEDRQRCAEAGMNDFLAKPVDPDRLYTVLAAWIPGSLPESQTVMSSNGLPGQDAPSGSADTPILDMAAGLKYSGGNEQTYQQMLGRFTRNHGDDVSEIRSALAKGELDKIGSLSHRLRGVAALLGARQLELACQKLEHAVRKQEKITAIESLVDTIAQQHTALRDFIFALPGFTPEEVEPGPANPEELLRLSELLLGQLQGDDIAAIRTWSRFKQLSVAVIPAEKIRRLEALVEAFDLPGAAEELARQQSAYLARPEKSYFPSKPL